MTKTIRLLALASASRRPRPRAAAADLDRAAVEFTTPADIKWVRNAAGTNEQAGAVRRSVEAGAVRRAHQVVSRAT